MKTRLSLILLFALFSLKMTAVPVSGPGEFVGYWEGLADDQVHLSLVFTLDGNDLTATLNAPDVGITDLSSESAEVSGGHKIKISFKMPDNRALIIAGALKEDGRFVGTYDTGEQAGVLALTKKEESE